MPRTYRIRRCSHAGSFWLELPTLASEKFKGREIDAIRIKVIAGRDEERERKREMRY